MFHTLQRLALTKWHNAFYIGGGYFFDLVFFSHTLCIFLSLNTIIILSHDILLFKYIWKLIPCSTAFINVIVYWGGNPLQTNNLLRRIPSLALLLTFCCMISVATYSCVCSIGLLIPIAYGQYPTLFWMDPFRVFFPLPLSMLIFSQILTCWF